MHIESIPMCEPHEWHEVLTCQEAHALSGTGSSNNYAYLVVDDKSKDAVIIDPANPSE